MRRNAPSGRQDDAAHIVASKTDATTGYIVFKANTTLGGSEVTSVSGLRHYRHPPTGCWSGSCRIADPDLNFIDKDKAPGQWGYSQPSATALTLAGALKTDNNSTATVTYPEPGNTEVTVRCQSGLTSSIKLILIAN